MRFVALAAFLFVSVWANDALADEDFAGTSPAWNGASRFVAIAGEHASVVSPSEVRLDDLRADDALFLLGPDHALPEDALVEFVRRGGRLVIADDYGSGARLFARFGMRATEPGATDAPRVRGDDALLVARPFYAHPLTEGVGVVVTNRPVLLAHPRLVPLVALEDGGPGLVVTGVVGAGRVVAIGDPSVFMNAMMELRGNRRLAENVIAFVTEGPPPRRLVLALGRTRVVGDFDGDATGTLRERTERQLRALADGRMPDVGLRIAAVVLAILSIMLLSTMREARLEPSMPWLDARIDPGGLESARLDALRESVLSTVSRRLGLATRAPLRDVRRALRTLGIHGVDERRILQVLAGRTDEATLRGAGRALDAAFARRDADARNSRDDTNGRNPR